MATLIYVDSDFFLPTGQWPAESAPEEVAAEDPAPEGTIPGRSATVELPLTEEKVTISVFQSISFAVTSIMEDLNDNLTA